MRFYGLDLPHEIWNNNISIRKLSVLVQGLPGEASVWRKEAFSPVEERIVQLMERNEAWHRAIFEAQTGSQKISVPGEITIQRPGQAQVEVAEVETDVNAIASWFAGG